jgi:hypothetical protein
MEHRGALRVGLPHGSSRCLGRPGSTAVLNAARAAVVLGFFSAAVVSTKGSSMTGLSSPTQLQASRFCRQEDRDASGCATASRELAKSLH